jgi:hypothetical protein
MPGEESSDARYDKLKQQLQQTILTEYPNPERKGCPGEAVLRELAGRYLDDSVESDPNWHHVTHCSPCYREYLDCRAEMKRSPRAKRFGMGVGLTVLAASLIVGGWYFSQRSDSTSPERPQIAEVVYRPRVVDLEGWSSTRSEEGKEPPKPIQLGRGPEELTIRLPFASRPGRYEVQLLKSVDQPLITTSGEAQLTDGTTVLNTKVDLSKLSPGRYLLGVRRLPADWTFYPSEIK